MSIKKPYGKRTRVPFKCVGESMTHQSFKNECDINFIMRKYQQTGLIDHVNQFNGDYSDLTENVDFQTALNITLDAQNAFDSLPSSLRKRFSNNPKEFLDFVSDESNIDEMKKIGLINSSADTDSSSLETVTDESAAGTSNAE